MIILYIQHIILYHCFHNAAMTLFSFWFMCKNEKRVTQLVAMANKSFIMSSKADEWGMELREREREMDREMYNIERCSQGHNKNSSQERPLQSTALMSPSRRLCFTASVSNNTFMAILIQTYKRLFLTQIAHVKSIISFTLSGRWHFIQEQACHINPDASFTWTKCKVTKERAISDHLFIAGTFELWECVCVCVDIWSCLNGEE